MCDQESWQYPGQHVFNGVIFSSTVPRSGLLYIRDDLELNCDDVIVATYPKSGNNHPILCNLSLNRHGWDYLYIDGIYVRDIDHIIRLHLTDTLFYFITVSLLAGKFSSLRWVDAYMRPCIRACLVQVNVFTCLRQGADWPQSLRGNWVRNITV